MIGRTISHYEAIERLGEGGMGVVCKAKDTHLDRFVAIKLLPADKVADGSRRRRFIQEAKAASALNHPNIITVHDISEEGGVHFIAMEGAAGIIHRDLKPTNIMVDGHSQVKVLDFGQAELSDQGASDDATATLGVRTDEGAITDHGYSVNSYWWAYTAKLARMNEDPGRLPSFLAEEWTSSFEEYGDKRPHGFYGHRNLILSDTFFPRWWNAKNRQTPAELWSDLRKMKANFVNVPHQLADTQNVPTAWDFADEQAQPVAEIFQNRGSYEYEGAPRGAVRTTPTGGTFMQDTWAGGLVIGVIASPDRGGGKGKACVYATGLWRESILEAIRERHTFGTMASYMVLDVRVNNRLMGQQIEPSSGKPVKVEVKVRCPSEIARVQVCRNNQFVCVSEPAGRTAAGPPT